MTWLSKDDPEWVEHDDGDCWVHRELGLQLWFEEGAWSYSREGVAMIYDDAESFDEAVMKALML